MADRADLERLGYEAPIRLGTWRYPKKWGAPRMASYGWLFVCIAVGFVLVRRVGMSKTLVCMVLGLWALGQVIMVCLTKWNPYWSDALFKRVERRYRNYYYAG